MQAKEGIDGDLEDTLRRDPRYFLDLDAAFGRGHHHRPSLGTVDDDAQIDLFGNVGRLIQQHFLDRQALDLHAQDLVRNLLCLVRVIGEADAASLATPTHQDLRFDDHTPAQSGGDLPGLLGCGRHVTLGDRDTIAGKDPLGLVFV